MSGRPEVTLVTGGSRHLGRAIVERQAAEGQEVVNLDDTPAPAGLPARTFVVDLADVEAIRSTMARLVAEHRVTRLVNHAERLELDSLPDLELDAFDRSMAASVRTALLCTQAVVPQMKSTGFGRIVNMTSHAALGLEHRGAYGAGKGALNTITRTWALELAPHGITVNAVAPGAVRGDYGSDQEAGSDPMAATIARSIALGRHAEPEEIAQAVAFFLDRRTSYATGQLLYMCGGLSIGGVVRD
jgi:3-oxoacyl-[acyl-carrier protein] reductase